MRQLHTPFRDLDVSKAPGSDFDELRAAHDKLKKEHREIAADWRMLDANTKPESFIWLAAKKFFFLGGNAMAARPLCAPALATPKTNRRRTAVRPRRPPRPPAPAA